MPRGKAKRVATPKNAEEKFIGVEITDFSNVTNINVAVRDNQRHYSYFNKNEDAQKWIRLWVKANMPDRLSDFDKAPLWMCNVAIGGLCRMHTNGAPFDANRIEWITRKVTQICDAKIEKTTAEIPKKSPAEILKEKASNTITELESILDNWEKNKDFDLFAFLKKEDAAKLISNRIVEKYKPLLTELEELVAKKTPDLVEAYRHMTATKQKAYRDFVKSLVANAESYGAGKLAQRKPRIVRRKKMIAPEKKVANVNYLKSSDEYKVTSVAPEKLVGAKTVYLFNVRYKTLTVLESKEGMSVRGTTIEGFTSAVKRTVRKPLMTLPEIVKGTPARAKKVYESLKTKEAESTGRVGKDTIILRVVT